MRKKVGKFNLESLKLRLFCYMIWIKENPLLLLLGIYTISVNVILFLVLLYYF